MAQEEKSCQALITRIPYAPRFKAEPILEMAKRVDARGLIFLSIPIHVEHPTNGARLACELEDAGLISIAMICWFRDRHIVTTRSRRLTNTWEIVALFGRQKNYHINREAATKIKKGFEGREGAFEEDEFVTCLGDHWPVRNDRRDRRFLPSGLVLNCGQLADLQPGDRILDPYGNPGVRDASGLLGWNYVDGGLANDARNSKEEVNINEDENVSRKRRNEEEDLESHSGSF